MHSLPGGMGVAWEVAVAVFAAVVGAGFVSGREIWVFFAMHGDLGTVLALAAAALLAAGAWRTAQTAAEAPRIALPWRVLLGIFGFVTLAAVVAALGSLAHVRLGLSPWLGGLLAALFAALAQGGGTGGLRRWQGALLILVVVAVLATAGLGLRHAAPAAAGTPGPPLQVGIGVLGYAAYNVALASDGVRRSAAGRGAEGRRGALAGGLAAGLLLTLEAAVLARSGALVAHADLPLRALALSLHGPLAISVEVAIAFASLSAAASFLQAAADVFGGTWPTAALAFLASTLGVQAIVDRAYPVMAVLALLWMLALVWPSALVGGGGPHRQGR